jgi:hypothetical protein
MEAVRRDDTRFTVRWSVVRVGLHINWASQPPDGSVNHARSRRPSSGKLLRRAASWAPSRRRFVRLSATIGTDPSISAGHPRVREICFA